MAISSIPYQAVPLVPPGEATCGCTAVDNCLEYITTDTVSFQVALTVADDALCGYGCDTAGMIQGGDFVPLTSGTNSTTDFTLTDLAKNFTTLGVQDGAVCGYQIKNTTLGTYSRVSIKVSDTVLTMSTSVFTGVGQTYEIYAFRGLTGSWEYDGLTASNLTDTTPLRWCSPVSCGGLVDSRLHVMTVDVVSRSGTVVMTARLGGDVKTINTSPDEIALGVNTFVFEPQSWANDQAELEFGGIIEIDDWAIQIYSTIGIKIFDCDGVELLDDFENSHGWITYVSGHAETSNDIRGQVSIPWVETGLEDGCFQVCLYDLCAGGCVLETYSIHIQEIGYNDTPCELCLEWTNSDDFELENNQYLDYPEYPGGTSYTQKIRIDGKVRFVGFVADDYTLNVESTGLREVVHFEGHEVYELQIISLDEERHRALAKGLGHDTFTINDEQYIWADGEYAPTWVKTSDKAPVVVKVIKRYSKGENSNP